MKITKLAIQKLSVSAAALVLSVAGSVGALAQDVKLSLAHNLGPNHVLARHLITLATK